MMTEQTERQDAESGHEENNYAWAFRGYHLDPAHFTTAMVHFYRGELARSNTWRTRLDTTTNWAVVTVGGALTFAFGAPQNPHFVLLLVFMLLLTFLFIEARRYRYYVLWAYRVHLMETNFFAAMLVPPFRPSPDWANHLAESLMHPTFMVTWWEAVGRRFRRNYVWLTTLLLISWVIKLVLHPTSALDRVTVIERASLGLVPGAWIVAAVGVVYGTVATMAVAATLRQAWRSDLQRPSAGPRDRLRRAAGPSSLSPRHRERLATIITREGRRVAMQILTELERGVTALEGTGMYTSEARDVLLCAVTDVQVPHLEEIVGRVDPSAFIIVSPTADVRGWGFSPFEAPS